METSDRQKKGATRGLIGVVVTVCLMSFVAVFYQFLSAGVQTIFSSSMGELSVWQFVMLVVFGIPTAGICCILVVAFVFILIRWK